MIVLFDSFKLRRVSLDAKFHRFSVYPLIFMQLSKACPLLPAPAKVASRSHADKSRL